MVRVSAELDVHAAAKQPVFVLFPCVKEYMFYFEDSALVVRLDGPQYGLGFEKSIPGPAAMAVSWVQQLLVVPALLANKTGHPTFITTGSRPPPQSSGTGCVCLLLGVVYALGSGLCLTVHVSCIGPTVGQGLELGAYALCAHVLLRAAHVASA